MKKCLTLILTIAMVFALSACAGLEELDLPPFPTPPAETAEPETPEEPAVPEEPEEAPVEVPETVKTESGSRVVVSINGHSVNYYAPDDEQQTILTFGYDDVTVKIEDHPEAAQAINDFIALKNEQYYMGNDPTDPAGGGVNGMLEMALDNYAYVRETGAELNLEFEAKRTAHVRRADERVVSLVFSSYSYAGDSQPSNESAGFVFDAQSGAQLTLADVTADPEALAAKLVDSMMAAVETDEAYAELRAVETLADELGRRIHDRNWVLTRDGLSVLTGYLELGEFANGNYWYTVPYAELDGLLDEKVLPLPMAGDYALDISTRNAGNVDVIDKVTAKPEGGELYITVEGVIYEAKISSVVYSSYSGIFNETAELWHCSHIENGAVQLAAYLPEGLPELMLSFVSADGEIHELLISVDDSGTGPALVTSDIVSVG